MAGGATIPASALICGSRIAMLHPSKLWSPLMAGTCALRLVVIPALCVAGLLLVPLPLDVRRVLVLISVMPAAMASVTLAEAYGGDADPNVTAEHLDAWWEQTSGAFQRFEFPGGHFYLESARALLLNALRTALGAGNAGLPDGRS